MGRYGLAVAAFIFAASTAFAQQVVPDAAMNDAQKHGRDMFAQHCVVCHMKTLLTSAGQWGPPLSGQTLGGDEKALTNFISYGTDKMPGFRLSLDAGEIADIAKYVKLLPAAPAAAK